MPKPVSPHFVTSPQHAVSSPVSSAKPAASAPSTGLGLATPAAPATPVVSTPAASPGSAPAAARSGSAPAPASTDSFQPAARTEDANRAEKKSQLLPDCATILERVRKPGAFCEEKPMSAHEVPPASGWSDAGRVLSAFRGDGDGNKGLLTSGDLGRIYAARFVNGPRRANGQVDFHAVYGEEAFHRWMKADALLAQIPKGQLADALNVELLTEVNRTVFTAPEKGLGEKLNWKAAGFRRGLFASKHKTLYREASGGVLRYDTVICRKEPFKPEQVEALKARGIRLEDAETKRAEDGSERIEGRIRYPAPEAVPAALEKLVADTKAALRDPARDPFEVASQFQLRFVSLHPFTENNGRTGRLVMDRILLEYGILPPILRDNDQDLGLTDAQYRQEVAEGAVRTAHALGATVRPNGGDRGWRFAIPERHLKDAQGTTKTAYGYAADLLRGVCGNLRTSASPYPFEVPSASLQVGGRLFTEAPDGFVYDLFGRPHIINDKDEIEPLGQPFFYAMIHRLAVQQDPAAALDALTKHTRERFRAAVESAGESGPLQIATLADPAEEAVARKLDTDQDGTLGREELQAGKSTAGRSADLLASLEKHLGPAALDVVCDMKVRAADVRYEARVPASLREDVLAMLDPQNIDLNRIVLPVRAAAKESTRASFAMSSWAQHDLEYWHLQKGFEKAGDKDAAEWVFSYRRALHGAVREYLFEKAADKEKATDENPLGLGQKFEQVMWEHSPLRFEFFDAGVAGEGDDKMTVFQGGTPFIAVMGLQPNDSYKNPDALEVALELEKDGVVRNLFEALGTLSGSAKGAPEMCTTSDLALLAEPNGFADKVATKTVPLTSFPGPVQELLRKSLAQEGETLHLRSLKDVLQVARGKLGADGGTRVDIGGIDPKLFASALADKLTYSGLNLPGASAVPWNERIKNAGEIAAQFVASLTALAGPGGRVADLSKLEGVTLSETDIDRIRSAAQDAADLVSITSQGGDELKVTIHRRAFAIELPKAGAMASYSLMDAGRFEYEQEIHALDKVWFNGIQGSWSQDDLAAGLTEAGPNVDLKVVGSGANAFKPEGSSVTPGYKVYS